MAGTITLGEFMSGDFRRKEIARNKKIKKLLKKSLIPIATGGTVGTLSLMASGLVLAAPAVVPVVVEAGAKQWMGEQTLSLLSHVLDPVVDILVALSFPVASVVIVGACFFFMLGNSEKAWTMIQNSALGYVLVQVSPLILAVLKKIGEAV
jgi:hypothetical protein